MFFAALAGRIGPDPAGTIADEIGLVVAGQRLRELQGCAALYPRLSMMMQ